MDAITRLPFEADFSDLSDSAPSIPEQVARQRRRFRTIWISDIHLGTRGCNAAMLIDFLDSTDSETMYLVGDIIDGWRMKRKFYWPAAHNDVVWRVMKRANRGTRVVYVPGNHDEMFRQFTGMSFGGVEIRRKAIHHTADGRKLLVIHGDEFDTIMLAHRWLAFVGDFAYEWLMRCNHIVNKVRAWMGKPYWSLSKTAKHKVKNAVEFISRFEEVVAHEADRLPAVVAHLDTDGDRERRTQGLVPLVVHGHESLVVDVDLVAVDSRDWHLNLLEVRLSGDVGGTGSVRRRAPSCRPSAGLPRWASGDQA